MTVHKKLHLTPQQQVVSRLLYRVAEQAVEALKCGDIAKYKRGSMMFLPFMEAHNPAALEGAKLLASNPLLCDVDGLWLPPWDHHIRPMLHSLGLRRLRLHSSPEYLEFCRRTA